MAKSYDIALFDPSDGLTPIQAKKLNNNFQRLLDLMSGKDEGSETTIKITSQVRKNLEPVIMDAAFPIGTLLLAKDSTCLPLWGKWREVTTYNNRFIRLGGNYGGTGGSASQVVAPQLPEHTHSYYKQVVDKTIKVAESTANNAKEVVTSIKDATTTSVTTPAGEEPTTQTISTIPPYMYLKLFERYE